ncbi:MAG: molybdopterin molybdotransferase MoeA [Thiotrichales bacterium]|nr:molybdopterin molybdotransferase MoeA [Thiotrichales bacterium]
MLMQAKPQLDDFDWVFAEVIQHAHPIAKHETLDLLCAKGRTLAQEMVSVIDLPRYPLSAMDGFALNIEDENAFLKILTSQFVGQPTVAEITAGQCCKIMTGAVIPKGCNAVLPIEFAKLQTRADGTYLLNPKGEISAGKNIKPIGTDLQCGQRLAAKGARLNAKLMGLLASAGIAQVAVLSQPKVALVTLGDELTDPKQALPENAIYNANWHLLESLLQNQAVDYVGHCCIPDDLVSLEKTLCALSKQADLILTVGGSSQGDKDFMPQVLQNAQYSRRYKLNMQPAKPLLHGKLNQAQILALPGNPIAAFLSYQLFAVPFLHKLCGLQPIPDFSTESGETVHLTQPIKASQKLRWIPVIKNEDYVEPLQVMSSQLALLCQADGFIRVEPGRDYAVGASVRYWMEQ